MTYVIQYWDISFGATYAAAAAVASLNNLEATSAPFTENINPALPAPPNTGLNFPSFGVQIIPEPTPWALIGLGIASVSLLARRGRSRSAPPNTPRKKSAVESFASPTRPFPAPALLANIYKKDGLATVRYSLSGARCSK